MTSQHNNKRHLGTNFTQWNKSSHSYPNGNECVEVSFSTNAVAMRDSHNPDHAALIVNHSAWTAFLDGITSEGLRPI